MVGALCLSLARSTVPQLGIFCGLDCMIVHSLFLCYITVCFDLFALFPSDDRLHKLEILHESYTFFGGFFHTNRIKHDDVASKIHLTSPTAVGFSWCPYLRGHFCCCLLFVFYVAPICLYGLVLGPCCVMQYFVFFLDLQSSCWGWEQDAFTFIAVLMACASIVFSSSSQCCGLVYSV